MPLQTVPTLNNLNTKEIERYLAAIQVKRLATQIEYQKARNLKLAMEHSKIEKRLVKQIEMLGKELTKLGEYEVKVKNRLSQVQILKDELDFTQDMIDGTE